MKTVKVSASREYSVEIGSGLLPDIGERVRALKAPCRAVLVSDDTVYGIYGEGVTKSLENSGFSVVPFVFPHGEGSKSLENFGRILELSAENKITRTDLFIALGGGVTGDLAGFAAASYLRGVDFVQIPTTLLAMVDSSVGGKTAVNLKSGKNLCGAFYQPIAVFADCDVLKTLPKEHFSEGCAEIIKYGYITDPELLELLQASEIRDNIEEIVTRCVEIKRDIVNRDEFENGERKLLNFGHTIGHAVEKCSGFTVSHGNAVAVGMMIAARGAYRTGLTNEDITESLKALLMKNKLPTDCSYSAQELYEVSLNDKKRSLDTVSLIVPESLGRCKIERVSLGGLKQFIELGME